MPIIWIEYKSKQLLLIDVSNLTNAYAKLEAELEMLVSVVRTQPKNSILAIADLRNTYLNNDSLLALMSNAPFAAPYFCKSALVIETNYARRIMIDSLTQFIGHLPRRFDNLDQAKDWLVSEK